MSDVECWRNVAFKAHCNLIRLRRQIETLQQSTLNRSKPIKDSIEEPTILSVFRLIKQPFAAVAVELLDAVHNSMTPLHLACMSDNPSAVQWLIRHGANVNLATSDGFTALHWAAMRGHEVCLDLLLKADAYADPLSIMKWTPLSRAVWRRSFSDNSSDEHSRLTQCMMLLLAYGAQIKNVKSMFRPAKIDIEVLAHSKQSGDSVGDWLESESELFLRQ